MALKILIMYTRNKGLLSHFFQELSERLNADNFEVLNFYLKHKESFFEENGVKIYGEKRQGFFANYYQIYKVVKKIRPDVIISNFSYINPAILFGRLLGVPHNVAWFHTAFGHTKPNFLKIINKTFYLNRANLVIANSKQLQTEMHTVYKVPKDRIYAIPFWTTIHNHRSNSKILEIEKITNGLTIGCPGRLVADKNHKLVIEAIYQLKQTSSLPIRLFIAGEGSYKIQLQQLVSTLHLEDEVVFLGLLDVDGMTAFYNAMDVVVLPSFHEAFGLVFIEAIALGRPVLVSKSFGALDFIDTHKFTLEDFSFDPHFVQELIDKLQPYLDNKGFSSAHFEAIYNKTFEKDIIYNRVKSVILNQK
jgi:glycosyltransferase involved in cell wall biosynthesis